MAVEKVTTAAGVAFNIPGAGTFKPMGKEQVEKLERKADADARDCFLAQFLTKVGLGDVSAFLRGIIASDSQWMRERLQDFDNELAHALDASGLASVVEKSKAIKSDTRYTPQAKQQMIREAFGRGILTHFEDRAADAMASLVKALRNTETVIYYALMPTPPEKGAETVRELRLQEVRAYLTETLEEERPGVVLKFGESAALEALAALVDDPAKRGLVSEKMLSMAKLRALKSMEVDFLALNLELAREVVLTSARRITAVGLAVTAVAKDFGVVAPGLAFNFEQRAAAEIERSESFLSQT